jgi:tetratricopeptide (TPR) repeat protein
VHSTDNSHFSSFSSLSLNTTSFFGLVKRSPDYDAAVHALEQAAAQFRNAGDPKRAVDAYQRAAHCYDRLASLFMAAKALEAAATLAASPAVNAPSNAADLFEGASRYYHAHSNPDKSADMLERAARYVLNVII